MTRCANPFDTGDGIALHFFFLAESPESIDSEGLDSLASNTEQWKLIGKVIYLYASDGIARSKLVSGFKKYIPVTTTARNWNTVGKLQSLLKNQ